MSAGVFQTSQAQYAAHRIATFPVGMNKHPAVRGYPRIGLRASRELAGKFVEAAALGFMCGERSGITVLDVDTTDEQVLADALGRHGATPIVVRTASGKWHAWYRHSNERRRIRPWGGDLPIDLLGTGGFVIAPPSATQRGRYEFIQGSLDDVASLPSMRGLGASLYRSKVTVVPDDALIAPDTVAEDEPSLAVVSEGRRNDTLFGHCMRHAHHCDDRDTLLEMARIFNERCVPPLQDGEVIEIVDSARRYTARGENRFGMTGSWLPTQTVREMVADPYLCTLVNFLQAENRTGHSWSRTVWRSACAGLVEGFRLPDARRSSGASLRWHQNPARATLRCIASVLQSDEGEKRERRCRLRIAYPFWLVWKKSAAAPEQCNGKRHHEEHSHSRRRAHAPLPPPARVRSTMHHANIARVPSLGARCVWFPPQGSAAK